MMFGLLSQNQSVGQLLCVGGYLKPKEMFKQKSNDIKHGYWAKDSVTF